MTRSQIKKQVEKIRDLLEDLRMEVESTIDEIEPYEGRDELTEQQEERQEWLEGLQYELESAYDNLGEYGQY